MFATAFPLYSASVLQCVAVCCSVLQGVAGCCRVLQSVAGCCRVLRRLPFHLPSLYLMRASVHALSHSRSHSITLHVCDCLQRLRLDDGLGPTGMCVCVCVCVRESVCV